MNAMRRLRAAPSCAAVIVALGLMVAGCSEEPKRDAETGELVEATDVNVFDLRVGDCLDGFTDNSQVSTIRAIPCAEEHTDEIMAAVELSDDEYPGAVAIQDYADETCYAEFEQFVGRPWNDSQLDYGFLAPTEDSWAEGDRQILCTVGDPNMAVTGTLRNANR